MKDAGLTLRGSRLEVRGWRLEVGGWRLEAANLLENNNRSILGVKQRSRSNEELASRGRTPRQHSKSNKVDTILVES